MIYITKGPSNKRAFCTGPRGCTHFDENDEGCHRHSSG